MNKSVVKEYAKAKVCVTLHSDKKVVNGVLAGTVGNYWVEYVEKADAVVVPATGYDTDWLVDNGFVTAEEVRHYEGNGGTAGCYACGGAGHAEAVTKVADFLAKAAGDVLVEGNANALVVYTKDPAKGGEALVTYIIEDGKIVLINYTKVCGAAEYATIKAFFGLEIGTCVDKDLIAANFGWSDEVKSCFAWKTENAVAIVDAECVVAIPKTGDMSVLAWLF